MKSLSLIPLSHPWNATEAIKGEGQENVISQAIIKKRTIYSGVLLGRRWWSVLTDGERTRSADGRTSRADVYQQQARADLCNAVRAPRRLKERLLTWLMTTPLLLLSLTSFAWISHCWLIVHPPRMRLAHNAFGLLKLAVFSRPKYHSCTESAEIQKCNFVILGKYMIAWPFPYPSLRFWSKWAPRCPVRCSGIKLSKNWTQRQIKKQNNASWCKIYSFVCF